jgi:hypothetical protein
LRSEERLTIRCSDSHTADRLAAVLAPDNVGVPRDQGFSVSRVGAKLVFRAKSEVPSSLFATAASVLNDVTLFQEIWLLSREVGATVGRQP